MNCSSIINNYIFIGDDIFIIENHKENLENKNVYLFSIVREKYKLIDFLKNNQNIKNAIFIIEDIELGLFSTEQKDIIDIVAKLYNQGNIFYITTNSPYILISFNDLIMANIVLNKYPNNEEISKKYKDVAVKVEDIQAYKIQEGKEPINIIDEKTELIQDEYIYESFRKYNQRIL